jgi:protein TonB
MPRQSTRNIATFVCGLLLAGGAAAQAANGTLNSPPRIDTSYPNQQPPYPDTAQINGEMGTVLVDVLVRPSGKPAKFKISQSSGYQDLDTAAIEGVLNWRFIPALRDGEQVSDWTTVKIVYQPPAMTPAPAPMPVKNP